MASNPCGFAGEQQKSAPRARKRHLPMSFPAQEPQRKANRAYLRATCFATALSFVFSHSLTMARYTVQPIAERTTILNRPAAMQMRQRINNAKNRA